MGERVASWLVWSSRDAALQGSAYVIGKKKRDWAKKERATVELFFAASSRNDWET